MYFLAIYVDCVYVHVVLNTRTKTPDTCVTSPPPPPPPPHIWWTFLFEALDAAGFGNTKIIAPDESIGGASAFVDAVASNPALRAATHAIGYHYPNSVTPDDAHALGIPIWASEDDSTVEPPLSAPNTPHPRQHDGGGCFARTINQNFVEGNMTATIVWNAIMARYPQLRWDFTGTLHVGVGPLTPQCLACIATGIG